jgi:hypothetical protein
MHSVLKLSLDIKYLSVLQKLTKNNFYNQKQKIRAYSLSQIRNERMGLPASTKLLRCTHNDGISFQCVSPKNITGWHPVEFGDNSSD